MSIGRNLRQLNAAWRVVMVCVLLGALAFAPVVRAVCDIGQVVVLAGSSIDTNDGATSSPQPTDHDGCCDDSATSITADVRPASDAVAFASPADLAWMPTGHVQVLTQGRAAFRGSKFALLPPEPVLKRVRKLLI
jgi:hypothetical protein